MKQGKLCKLNFNMDPKQHLHNEYHIRRSEGAAAAQQWPLPLPPSVSVHMPWCRPF